MPRPLVRNSSGPDIPDWDIVIQLKLFRLWSMAQIGFHTEMQLTQQKRRPMWKIIQLINDPLTMMISMQMIEMHAYSDLRGSNVA